MKSAMLQLNHSVSKLCAKVCVRSGNRIALPCLPDGFTVTAHTGSHLTPPNSLTSVKEAILSGADVLEVDLTFRPDGTPVIIHSAKPKNTEGVLFSQVLEEVAKDSKIKMNLDLKAFWNLPEIERLVKEYSLTERAFFTGVFEEYTGSVKSDCPSLSYYYNFRPSAPFGGTEDELKALAQKINSCGAVGINLNKRYATPLLCKIMRENGLLASVWTVNKTSELLDILSLAPDNITTKRPVKLLKILNR